MTTYRQPSDQRLGPNCGPTSVAVLTGKPLGEVMSLIRDQQGFRANWKGSTRNRGFRHGGKQSDCYQALEASGVNPVVEGGLEATLGGKQLRTVIKHLPRDKAWFICTSGHAQAVVDGRIFDQGTKPEGSAIDEFWGAKKKVQVIFSCDRIDTNTTSTTTNEVTDMTITDFTTDITAAVAAVAENEAAFQATNGECKDLRKAANVTKIAAYAHLIEVIIDAKIKKGSKKAGALRAALEAAGVSKACAKRYCEIGQAAAKLPLIVEAYKTKTGTGNYKIVQTLEENDIETEAALKNVCFPKVEKTLVEKLVDLAERDSDDAEAAVQALLDAAAAINPGVRVVADNLVAALAA